MFSIQHQRKRLADSVSPQNQTLPVLLLTLLTSILTGELLERVQVREDLVFLAPEQSKD